MLEDDKEDNDELFENIDDEDDGIFEDDLAEDSYDDED